MTASTPPKTKSKKNEPPKLTPADFELMGSYEQIIAKAPGDVSQWPLSKVVHFKDSVVRASKARDKAEAFGTLKVQHAFLKEIRHLQRFY